MKDMKGELTMRKINLKKEVRKFKYYMRRTYKNKIMATLLITIGFLSAIFIGEASFLLFTLVVGIPLFITKENFITY